MLPVELQNSYFRTEYIHSLTSLAAVHHDLAQRHLEMRLQQDRHNQETQVQEMVESQAGSKQRLVGDESGNRGRNFSQRGYILVRRKNRPQEAVLYEAPQPGRQLDITA